jgi:hypothetical protein
LISRGYYSVRFKIEKNLSSNFIQSFLAFF